MGLDNRLYNITVLFRDGMTGRFHARQVSGEIRIQELCRDEDKTDYSRVGLMTTNNQNQTTGWFWIMDRTRTLESCVQESLINMKDNVHVTFFV